MLIWLSANLIRRLQSVTNAAARRIFEVRRSEHITEDALASLHWLRFPERILFNGDAPAYPSSNFTRIDRDSNHLMLIN